MKKNTLAFSTACLMMLFLIINLNSCTTFQKTENINLFFEPIEGSYKIPENFNSYTMFFVASNSYTDKMKKNDLKKLKKEFKSFGKSIGENNLAVWVKKPNNDDLNIEMGKIYLDRLHQWYKISKAYNDGPFLLYLTHHPDVMPKENDFAAIMSFSNQKPKHIIESMEYLEASIRRGTVSPHNVISKNFWIDMKSFVSQYSEELKGIIVDISKIIIKS